MAIIGNFTKQDNGFQGTITTLTLGAKVSIVPVEKSGDTAPDFRVFASRAEIGAEQDAVALIQVDQDLPEALLDQVRRIAHVVQVRGLRF